MRIVLASGSPRRKELLEMLNVKNLEIIPAQEEEAQHPNMAPDELVKALSFAKAEEVSKSCHDAIVIGADTVVSCDGRILGKPKSEAEAFRMLRLLSGRRHSVFTGVTVFADGAFDCRSEQTYVTFLDLSDEDINRYIAIGECMDKAGAYGAQGYASVFVSKIEGDFFNVMGLPLCRLGQMLKKLGVNLI